MKRSKTSKSQCLKDPTHAWVLGLWNQWFALNKDRFHYPLVCKQAGGYTLIMGFQGLHPGLTFEISMDGSNNGIYFCWDGVENKGLWDCLHEADLSEYRTPDSQYYCGLCEEADKITYYPSREAQWEQHVFEEMLVWGNDNLHSGRIIVPYCNESWGDEACGAWLETPENAVRRGYTNQSVWIPVVVGRLSGKFRASCKAPILPTAKQSVTLQTK